LETGALVQDLVLLVLGAVEGVDVEGLDDTEAEAEEGAEIGGRTAISDCATGVTDVF
jgi:hypothetical protein